MQPESIKGPFILWLNYGRVEGWKPHSYDTLKEAVDAKIKEFHYVSEFVITRPVKFSIVG